MMIALEGPKAVGKSTLTAGLDGNGIVVMEGFSLAPLQEPDEDTFCQNQALYIRQKIEQLRSLREATDYLIVRGPENILHYTLYYPLIKHKKWNVQEKLQDEIAELRQFKSDRILYLNASQECLLERAHLDPKKQRVALTQWLNDWYEPLYRYFSRIPYSFILNTECMTPDEVKAFTISLFTEER